jgi:polysaccharide deacetylase 2 family uncharacterized protein YibQ
VSSKPAARRIFLRQALACALLSAAVSGLTFILLPFPDAPPAPEPPPPKEASPPLRSPGGAPETKELARDVPSSAGRGETPPPAGLAVVIDDLGENMQVVHRLLALDLPLTFSVWPHARFAEETARAAHEAGLELLIHLPMQPRNPKLDAGPHVLSAGMPRGEMEAVLRQSLRKLPGAAGLNNHMGSRFTCLRAEVRLFCEILAPSGLFVLDSVTHHASVLYEEARRSGIAAARRDLFLDAQPGKKRALAQFNAAGRLALQGKRVIAVGHPLPETLAALSEWSKSRNPGIVMLRVKDCLTPP